MSEMVDAGEHHRNTIFITDIDRIADLRLDKKYNKEQTTLVDNILIQREDNLND